AALRDLARSGRRPGRPDRAHPLQAGVSGRPPVLGEDVKAVPVRARASPAQSIFGGGRKERAVRRATTVGRGAKPPSELSLSLRAVGDLHRLLLDVEAVGLLGLHVAAGDADEEGVVAEL